MFWHTATSIHLDTVNGVYKHRFKNVNGFALQSLEVGTDTLWPTKPKIFAILTFTEKGYRFPL